MTKSGHQSGRVVHAVTVPNVVRYWLQAIGLQPTRRRWLILCFLMLLIHCRTRTKNCRRF